MSNGFKVLDIIQSKDNPRIKQFCALAKAKKQRINEGLFVLEGIRLVTDAIKNGAEIEYILATKKALCELENLDLKLTKVFEISQQLSEKISQTQTPQGIFAVCRMLHHNIDFSKPAAKYLMLCDIQDNGNLGMIMRTADALGVDGIILSNCCDVYSPKTVRATMGSIFRVKFILVSDSVKTLEMLKENSVFSYAAVVDGNAKSVSGFTFPSKSCVLIGNEGNGLEDYVVEACNDALTIKMNGTIESLNAAMAAGIMLWELCGKDVK